MKTLLIIGAKSDIAKACAREFAKKGFNLQLAARNIEELTDFKKDIKTRYQRDASLFEFDITHFDKFKGFFESLNLMPDGVLIAAGYMPEQKKAETNCNELIKTLNVNFTGAACFLNIVAENFIERKSGFIIGISSVAGDRGRRSNFIYGASKSAFTTYLSGLRNKLYSHNINVITVKPGFVRTKMTENMDLPEKLTANPEDIAKDIFKAYRKKKNIVYTKGIWSLIMFVIKHIPEFIFKRTNI